eukprot:824428-Rhodomonas_salina.1
MPYASTGHGVSDAWTDIAALCYEGSEHVRTAQAQPLSSGYIAGTDCAGTLIVGQICTAKKLHCWCRLCRKGAGEAQKGAGEAQFRVDLYWFRVDLQVDLGRFVPVPARRFLRRMAPKDAS